MILKVEYKDNPFNKTKLLSEISTSCKISKRNTKIEDEVIIESSDGKEYDLKLAKITEKMTANEI